MKYKKRNKPFYKQFLRLRQNVQNRTKLFTFKKQKWQRFNLTLKKQLKFLKKILMNKIRKKRHIQTYSWSSGKDRANIWFNYKQG